MRYTVTILCLLVSLGVTKAQPPRSVNVLRDSLRNLEFIFEGYITDSKLYLGDKQGRELDHTDIVWHDSIGTIRGYDTSCFAFERAGILVIDQFKGRLWDDHPNMVLSKLGNIKRIWYQVGSRGDTVLNYAMDPDTKKIDEFQMLLSKKEFSRRRLFFCKRWVKIDPYNYREADSYSNLQTLFQIPLDPNSTQFTIDPNGQDLLYPFPLNRLSQLVDLLTDL